MRWYVDLTPLGGGTPEKLCLEAGEWQRALRDVREKKGHDAPIGALSVEVLDDGFRAVDPTVKMTYLIRRAPDDAPLEDGTPRAKRSSRQSIPRAEAPPAPPPDPKPAPQAVTPLLAHEVLSRRVVDPSEAQPIRYVELAIGLSDAGLDVSRAAVEALLHARLQGEVESLTGEGGTFLNLAVFARAPSGKPMRRPIATLAFKDWVGEPVVDHFEVPMSTPTPSAPVAPVSVPESDAITQRRPTPAPAVVPEAASAPSPPPKAPSVPPPPKVPSVPPPPPKAPSVPPQRMASGPPPALPASAFAPIVPPAAPLPGLEVDVDVDDERDTDLEQRDTNLKERDTEISTQLSPPSDAPATAEPKDAAGQRPETRSAPPAAPPAPPPVDDDLVATQQRPRVDVARYLSPKTEDLPPTRLTAEEPPSTRLSPVEAPQAALPDPGRRSPSRPPAEPKAPPVDERVVPLAAQAPIAPAPAAARAPSVPPVGVAADLAVLPPELEAARPPPPPAPPPPDPTPTGATPTPLLDRREKPEPATMLAGAKRFRGDELISELFDACGELSFSGSVPEGLDYVVSILLEKLPCEVLVLSLYDIDKNEFVVVRQAGGRNVVLQRFKGGATVKRCMKTSQVAVLAHSVELGTEARWQEIGIPPRSLLLVPVENHRRDMGLLELANPHDGSPFTAADGDALAYLGKQLGEFLAERGVDLEDEALVPPRESIPPAIRQQIAPGAKPKTGKTSPGKGSGKTSGGKGSGSKSSGGKPRR